jgi:hypothetical protein
MLIINEMMKVDNNDLIIALGTEKWYVLTSGRKRTTDNWRGYLFRRRSKQEGRCMHFIHWHHLVECLVYFAWGSWRIAGVARAIFLRLWVNRLHTSGIPQPNVSNLSTEFIVSLIFLEKWWNSLLYYQDGLSWGSPSPVKCINNQS